MSKKIEKLMMKSRGTNISEVWVMGSAPREVRLVEGTLEIDGRFFPVRFDVSEAEGNTCVLRALEATGQITPEERQAFILSLKD
jgi:hypothetical protein